MVKRQTLILQDATILLAWILIAMLDVHMAMGKKKETVVQ
jgi:hypothetical protein